MMMIQEKIKKYLFEYSNIRQEFLSFFEIGNSEREQTGGEGEILEIKKLVASSNTFSQKKREKYIAGDFGLKSLKFILRAI